MNSVGQKKTTTSLVSKYIFQPTKKLYAMQQGYAIVAHSRKVTHDNTSSLSHLQQT